MSLYRLAMDIRLLRRVLGASAVALAFAYSVFGQTYTIKTVAGGGSPQFITGTSSSSAPAVGVEITLDTLNGVALDPAGNVFIALSADGVVLRLDASTGLLTRVAGNGTPGFSGDNGPATSAQLNPAGIAVDSAGNLYIADFNYRIRKVSNGVITTVAGNGTLGFSGDNGPATGAQLGNLGGVAVDSSGNLYIADSVNNRIRKVSNGVISTVAGGGPPFGDDGLATGAQLNMTQGVAVDSTGNLYIADSGDNRIRKVSNGVITSVAGNGRFGFSGDNGPASGAELESPFSIAVDSAASLYVADRYNNRIRKVSNGVITTVAGGGPSLSDNGPATGAQLSGPLGVAVDSAGNLYIADSGNNRIRKVSNGVITTVAGGGSSLGDNGPATSAQLSGPSGVALDSAGSLYIADSFNARIRKVSNGVITTVAGNGTGGFSGDNGPATSAQLSAPSGVAVDSTGGLYIADLFSQRVRKVSNGVITTVAGNGTYGFGGDNGPATGAELVDWGVAVDAGGNVYIADGPNRRVRVLTPSGSACSASVSTTTLQPAATGGDLAVAVQTNTSSCVWAVQNLPSWITYSGTSVVTGSATITLAVAANTGAARSATVSIAGVSVSVAQAGAPGSLSIASITNAASNRAGPIAPGEIVVIKGSGLGPAQLVQATVGSDGLYDSQLAGTTVSVNGMPAHMIYSSATQVAAVVPYGITGGTAQVTVTYQSQTTAPFSVPIAASAPGIFTYDSTGGGQAAAINQDGITINGAAAPARVGDVISLYATGEGQTSPNGVDGKPSAVPYPQPNLPVTVTIGGQTVRPQYAGGAPGEVAGVMQINVQIPNGIQTGNAVPVVVQVGNVSSQSGITIAVRGN